MRFENGADSHQPRWFWLLTALYEECSSLTMAPKTLSMYEDLVVDRTILHRHVVREIKPAFLDRA